MIEGIRKLGWPAIELRLWQEWDEGDLIQVAGRVRATGVEVGSVHVPPDSEALLSTPGHERDAEHLMEKCLAAALAAGAKVAVIHAWDLRHPEFSRDVLTRNLNGSARFFESRGVTLSVESIPGHTRMLPVVAARCPEVTFTADTRWAALEDSWDLLSGLIPRLTNIHVQTYVDPVPGGGVALGRTALPAGAAAHADSAAAAVTGGGADAGRPFDAERVMRRFAHAGYAGLVTLEPNGVPGVNETHLRQALEMLAGWR
jgi:sugar phosphate isomerase/epimerase